MEIRNRRKSGRLLIGESSSGVQTFSNPGDLDYEHHLGLYNGSQLALEAGKNSSRASQAEVTASALASARALASAEAADTALEAQRLASSSNDRGM